MKEALQQIVDLLQPVAALADGTPFEHSEVIQRCVDASEIALEALAQPAQQEPVAWIHNFIEGGISIGKRPADLNRHPDRWTALYKDPTPCQTCQALARTVMLDQTSHDTTPPQPEERNFCPRCGKRTADLTVIHTCTPPQENT